jgi:SAM-dependent methyltransferase
VSLSGASLLDYGFGAGTLFRYCPSDCSIFGVEQDEVNVRAVTEMLRVRGHERVDLQPLDIRTWESHPLLGRQYDVFVCSHVLEHLPDPPAFLARALRCVKPGGLFLGLVPLNELADNPHHLWKLDRTKILEWGAASGSEVALYEENDPWLYWFQPLFAAEHGMKHRLAQAVSIALGTPATLFGQKVWFGAGSLYSFVSRSRPTQAVFAFKPRPS